MKVEPKIRRESKRVRIYTGEGDKYKGKPLYHAIVEEARRLGLAGATVFRGIEGYGANSRIHTARLLDLSVDLPIVIEIVDSEEYMEKITPFLDKAVEGGLITVEDVSVMKYVQKKE